MGAIIIVFLLVLGVFAGIGITYIYREYKNKKWEKEYGSKLEIKKRENERQVWIENKKSEDKLALLENYLKTNGLGNVVEENDSKIASKDYISEYKKWRKDMKNFKALTLLSMSGCLPERIRTFGDYKEDIKKCENKS